MRTVVVVVAMGLSLSAFADEWSYKGPIRILEEGETNQGVEITEAELQERLKNHRVVVGPTRVKSRRLTHFPTWFTRGR